MSYWREEELSARGVATKNSLKIRFNNKVYVRVKTLPRQFYEQGQKLEAEYAAQNLDSLLIEHKNWIAIWREELNPLGQIERNDRAGNSDLVPSSSKELNDELTDGQKRAEFNEEDALTLLEGWNKAKKQKYRGGADESNISDPSWTKEDDTITISQPIERGKRLWDYLELSSRLAVPLGIARGGYWFQQRERKKAEEQAELSRVLVQKKLAEEARKDYLKSMVELLLDRELRAALFPAVHDKFYLLELDNPVREVARLKTITILRRLEGDPQSQARIIHFLQDAELDKFIFKNANLWEANLSGANLSGANLSGANLERANLSEANLSGANLERANLSEANLSGSNLSGANLSGTNLSGTDLSEINLSGTNLSGANLLGANLSGTDLSGANLSGANLWETNLERANLSGADLWGTNLERANLERANLERAKLRGANLERAYLGQAELKGANLERVKLSKANLEETNLRGANLTKVENLKPKQLKLARCWSQAIYQENEQENQRYIEELQKAQSLDPSIPIDFELWEEWH